MMQKKLVISAMLVVLAAVPLLSAQRDFTKNTWVITQNTPAHPLGVFIREAEKKFSCNLVLSPELENLDVNLKLSDYQTLSELLKVLNEKMNIQAKVFARGILLQQTNRITESDGLSQVSKNQPQKTAYRKVMADCKSIASECVAAPTVCSPMPLVSSPRDFNTEEYNRIQSNGYKQVMHDPLSTFSIDVDTAAYANVRRFLTVGELPPKDAVRLEEMINYFTYKNPQPEPDKPFAVSTELSGCPWEPSHKLVKIALQGKELNVEKIPASNLVFLIDVSGSMSDSNKLPLLKKAFHLLVNNLRSQDRVSIVVYAGAAGVVLNSVPGSDHNQINDAIDNLEAGGSTAGGAGIQLAYDLAARNLMSKGNNRVILATDGDFNVGVSNTGALTRLIESKRDQGIYLSVLGFGMGNYKDNRLESLADQGNGNYAYIDNLLEAKKVLVNQLGGTLFTIANDVKIQVEFNPAKVSEYRLIGYENRLLNREDFDNDKKDAGEMGAGHTVTALYELIPSDGKQPQTRDLHYSTNTMKTEAKTTDDVMTVKVRYKTPGETQSKLLSFPLSEKKETLFQNASADFQFASAVAEMGMLLTGNEYKKSSSYEHVIQTAGANLGPDENGYRSEFVRLARIADLLASGEIQKTEK